MTEGSGPAPVTLANMILLVALFMPLASYAALAWFMPERLREMARRLARRKLPRWELGGEWLWTARIVSLVLVAAYVGLVVWYIVRATGAT